MGDRIAIEEIGQRFIEAFNRRDAEGLIVLTDEAIKFHPTPLAGGSRTYLGHAGIRQWVADLNAANASHQVRILEIRPRDETSFVMLTEVLIEDKVISPSAMLAHFGEDGLLIEAQAYLSDQATLRGLGIS